MMLGFMVQASYVQWQQDLSVLGKLEGMCCPLHLTPPSCVFYVLQ